mmetsp:Transcript_41360/g.107046  ORF Transcript_41360/g.107046 Transcript_41360/m.107046 type:complete len:201 (-) Transcript_41360:175-777(-)
MAGMVACSTALRGALAAAVPRQALLGWLPMGARGIKYRRNGFWARGDHGTYTMDDPRIYRPGLERKYPHYKQRTWSKPYMCLEHNGAPRVGGQVRLAISYKPWEGAASYYALRRALEAALPGAQILGDANQDLEEASLQPGARGDRQAALIVMRLNDGRELLRLHAGAEREALEPETFQRLVAAAVDNFDWRYGAKELQA